MSSTEAADKLRTAGFRVLESHETMHVLPPGADQQHGWVKIPRAPDGSLLLVKERSALHRRIAGIIGEPAPSMPDGMV